MASPKFDITGTVYRIPPPRQAGEKSYASFVVEIDRDTKYPQFVPFDCKDEIAGKVQEGDEVTVSFNLRGREWTNPSTGDVKFFGSLQAWKVDVVRRAAPVPPPAPNGGGWGAGPGGPSDDLPF